ncbi:hypothetical protein BMS3Abin15_00200 [bacterium BMS3Abin15]|nr:hypothetical protein BMS3Abin15_00200 [bacterium BMS3Abin15]HDZ84927.1 hypothetical protein [Candidatus Moranbacteria bacterium]
MQKKYYVLILLGVFVIIAGLFLALNQSKAPSISPAPSQSKISDDAAPVKIDLENDADFEQDVDDFDVSEEVLDDFDSEDFDADTIDDNVL